MNTTGIDHHRSGRSRGGHDGLLLNYKKGICLTYDLIKSICLFHSYFGRMD